MVSHSRPVQKQFHNGVQEHGTQERYFTDLQYRDKAFVYSVIMAENELGENVEGWSEVPNPVACSFQEHAIDSQITDPGEVPNRFANVFTRFNGAIKWRDKVVVRGITYIVIKVLERFDNGNGQHMHDEVRMCFIEEDDSIETIEEYLSLPTDPQEVQPGIAQRVVSVSGTIATTVRKTIVDTKGVVLTMPATENVRDGFIVEVFNASYRNMEGDITLLPNTGQTISGDPSLVLSSQGSIYVTFDATAQEWVL